MQGIRCCCFCCCCYLTNSIRTFTARFSCVFLFLDTLITTPRFSTFLNFSSYIEYSWLETGRSAKERLEVRFQFSVFNDGENGNGLSSLENSLLVYLGQSAEGKSKKMSWL